MSTLAGKPITSNGLGLMRLTWRFGVTPDEQAFKVLKEALENGANVWNGADFYGTPDANSLHLCKRYFTKYPEDASKVVLCIKSGVVDMHTFQLDCSPSGMRSMVDYANGILAGTKKIDIFGPARVDPNVPVEATVAALGELVSEGKIGGIQLTEARAETIRRAAKVHKIDMVEAEFSLWSTEILSNGVAETCEELGIVISAYSPLGAGMLTGHIRTLEDMQQGYGYQLLPRYQEDNFRKNLELVNGIEELAQKKRCTVAQLALNWIKTTSNRPGMPHIVPIFGARSEERVRENCTDVVLDEEDLKKIKEILETFPVAGDRWPAAAAKLNEY